MAKKNGDKGDALVASDGYESSNVLVASINDSGEEWVLDSRCSFHMSPHKDWFQDLYEYQGGMVLLDDNKACKVSGIGSIRVKMFDGCIRILQEVRHVPEQNGLAERFNRTILERVRCMLTTARLSRVFWAETVKTACYLIDLCPSAALGFKTPQQVWSSGHAASSSSSSDIMTQ